MQPPIETTTAEFGSTGMFQKAMLMAMVHRSRLMQQETLWARVKGLRDGGSTMDTQMCSSLKPVDVRLWKIFLTKKEKNKKIKTEQLNLALSKAKDFIFSVNNIFLPETCDLVAFCRIKGFLGHSVSLVRAQPAVTEEMPNIFTLKVLYGHFADIPYMWEKRYRSFW